MMITTRFPGQKQALQYGSREHLAREDGSIGSAEDCLWESIEYRISTHQDGSDLRPTHASSQGSSQSPSPQLQGSQQCYTRRISEPVQPMELVGYSYGRYPGAYSSRASSTLPSPSPMTPNTDDMIDQWTGRRRPSDFATSAAQPGFSPKSPNDYDFPTGAHLPPLMNGSQEPTPRAELFPERLETYQSSCYLDHRLHSLDVKSSCIPMNGPPYPAHILDHNVDIYPEPFLDPHVLNAGTFEDSFTSPEELLNMDYGAELQVPGPQDTPYNALSPIQEDEYIDTADHAHVHRAHNPLEGMQQALPLSGGIQSREPASQQSVHQAESSQRALDRRPSHQIRSNVKANNQCSTCNKAHETLNKLRKHIRKEHVRPYPCIFSHYGCNSVFGTKNEWSRHVKVQHLRLETWKCNIDECEKHTNDDDVSRLPSASKGKCEYDRKDLFLNHVRRCHKDQYPQPGTIEGARAIAYEDQVQSSCHLTLRAPPMRTLCPCCPGTIWSDFDARLEHIGRTMEANEDARAQPKDLSLEMYMVSEGLLQWRDQSGWLLTGAEGKKGGKQARRGSQQRPLTIQAPLTAAEEGRETLARPARKSKRVELKKQKQQQQRQRQNQREEANSDEDAEADDDDDYDGTD